ncbi:ankyrin repeat domain-containing protein [uncultured Tenacibaculum sp.]|uniref:ankyrin repeat domain-containing protein n=1 Tax=uncultured Tenacibaculum sp. TaxID=174713 RepID=UPI00260BF3C3|nr:ankyrin repeat domain-containing protein [uncultured Tenacibaculum sp.]
MSGGDWKAMFKAIQDNDIELLTYYLKLGIDPNYQHPEFMALPLAEAIRYNHLEMVKLLLSKGTNPLLVELETGKSIVEIALQKGNKEIIELIKSYKN